MRILPYVVLLGAVGCGSEGGSDDRTLKVTWAFESGDCASNAITKVKVTWGESSGTRTDTEFDCSLGAGKLGETGANGGSYSITAVGLDSGGVARVTHFGTTLNVGSHGTLGQPVELTLRPKPVRLTLTWGDSSSRCPSQVVLPYFLTLYNPADGGTPTDQVDSTQESCSTGTATFTNSVKPGSYVVDLDSRAISPMVKSTKPITVVAGEDLTVSMF